MTKVIKKTIVTILLLCTALAFACFAACNVGNPSGNPTETPKHTHTYVETVSEKYLKSAATCTEKAVYYKSCSCGEKGATTFEYGTALGHSYTNYVSDNNATCVNDGTETATCARGCGTTDTRTIENSALGHDFTEWQSNGNDTHTRTCNNDNCSYYETKDCHGGAATCTEQATCEDCNSKYGEAKGHEFTNYISDENSTCESDGTETAKCDHGCGTTDTRAIENSAFGHDWKENGSVIYCAMGKSQKYKCSNCSKEKEEFVNTHVTGENLSDVHKSLSVDDICEYCGGEVLAKNGDSLVIKLGEIYQVEHYLGTAVQFSGYESLINSAYISNEVTEIKGYAFSGCSSLTSVTIPNSVTSIGDYAFYNCSSLNKVKYMGTIDQWVQIYFGYDNPLSYAKNFYINNELVTEANITTATVINAYAFKGYDLLTSVTIGNDVTSIGSSAFEYCDKLVEVINKSSLTITKGSNNNGYVGSYALNVKTEGESEIVNKDGYLFYTHDNVNYLLGYVGNETSLVLPDNYNRENYEIYKNAFYNCSSLTSIKIGNSVTSIGYAAFRDCGSLTNVTIGSGVTSIGSYAFYGCSSLTSITIPDSVTRIGIDAFEFCSSLSSVTIGNSVTSIGYYAFRYCISLTSVTIGNSVSSIGSSAFYDCCKLVEVINKSKLTITKGSSDNGYVGNYALNIKTEGESEIVNKDGYLFYTYNNVNCLLGYVGNETSLTLPDNYNGQSYKIYNYAFSGCSSLTSITIPNSVTSIRDYAFENCSSLTSVTIGNSVTSIGNYAFEDCYKLVEVINKSSLTITKGSSNNGYVGYYALNVKTKGESDITKTNDGYLFYTYNNVNYLLGYVGSETSLTLPENYNGQNYEIYKYAFYNCSSLTSITIPNGVTCIKSGAFKKCSSLSSVTFENPNGWYVSYNSTGTDLDLADATKNATYLKSTYDYYDWKRG